MDVISILLHLLLPRMADILREITTGEESAWRSKNNASIRDNGDRNGHRNGPINKATGNVTVILARTGNAER